MFRRAFMFHRLLNTSLSLILISSLAACSSSPSSSSKLPIVKHSSVGQNERIQTLVLHFTAGNYKRSLFALKQSGAVSSHYLIPDPNDDSYQHSQLQIIQLVDEDKRAWHAGHSYWQGRTNLNDSSIGIEVVNKPECRQEKEPDNVYFRGGEYGLHMACDFPNFSEQQIELLVDLSKDVLARNPDISPTKVIGHSDIAPARKSDPGPSFPWYELYKQGVGAWYTDESFNWYLQLFQQHEPSLRLVQKALHFYGYEIEQTGLWDEQTANVLYAFQTHFLPESATGEPTIESAAAVFALLDRYKEGLLKVLLQEYFFHAELLYSKQLNVTNKDTHKWLIFRSSETEASLKLDNLKENKLEKLDLYLNGVLHKKMTVPHGVSALTIPIEVSKGEHLLELKSKQSLTPISVSISLP